MSQRADVPQGLAPALLRDAAFVLAVLSSLAYLSSWGFDNTYLRQFGIDSSLFSRTVDQRLADGFSTILTVLLRAIPWILGLVLVVLASLYVLRRFRPTRMIDWINRKGLEHGLLTDSPLATTHDRWDRYFAHLIVFGGTFAFYVLILGVSGALGEQVGREDRKTIQTALDAGGSTLPLAAFEDPATGQLVRRPAYLLRNSDRMVAVVIATGTLLIPNERFHGVTVRK